MSHKKLLLKYIDKANQVLMDARQHTQKDSLAYQEIKSAYRYIAKTKHYIDLEKEKGHHSTCGHDCCPCCCCHLIPKPSRLTSQKFFAKVSDGIKGVPGVNDLIIPASSFIDNMGNPVTSFPAIYDYTTLYINGMIQQNGAFILTPSSSIVINGGHLDSDDPIVIEMIIQA